MASSNLKKYELHPISLKCDSCSESFQGILSLGDHLVKCNVLRDMSAKTLPYRCNVRSCKMPFYSLLEHKLHVETAHPGVSINSKSYSKCAKYESGHEVDTRLDKAITDVMQRTLFNFSDALYDYYNKQHLIETIVKSELDSIALIKSSPLPQQTEEICAAVVKEKQNNDAPSLSETEINLQYRQITNKRKQGCEENRAIESTTLIKQEIDPCTTESDHHAIEEIFKNIVKHPRLSEPTDHIIKTEIPDDTLENSNRIAIEETFDLLISRSRRSVNATRISKTEGLEHADPNCAAPNRR